MKRWLIVWGSAADQIRVGEGSDERTAAKTAFGSFDSDRMSFKPINLDQLRSDRQRTRMCYDLLDQHVSKVRNSPVLDDNEKLKIVSLCAKVRADLLQRWANRWNQIRSKS